MKKQITLLLVSASFALVGCASTNGSLLPSGATSLDQSAGIDHLSAAMNALTKEDAFGVRLNSLSLSASADINVPTGTTPTLYSTATGYSVGFGESSLANYKGSIELSGVKGSVMGKGLTATAVNDVKASASLEGSLKASYGSISYDYSGMSVNAYLASGNLYLDLTNAKTVEFINEILSYSAGYSTMINPSDGTMTSLAPAINTLAAGKYLETGVLKADALPLLSEKTQKNISDDMASWSANLKANKDYFKTYSYANGNYAIDLSLTKETLLGLMSAATSAASSEAGGMTSAISSIERMISKFVTINACQEVFVFNDKGPVSSALNVDIAVNTTLGEIYSEATSGVSSAESIPDGYSSAKEAVSFKFAYNMDFLSGDNVAVSEVSDPSAYSVPSKLA
jgi:hypothetical protein